MAGEVSAPRLTPTSLEAGKVHKHGMKLLCARTRRPDGVHGLDVLEEGRCLLVPVLHRDLLLNGSHGAAAAGTKIARADCRCQIR